jgi:GntR family transcriptional regulator/MocR family aminotransferase
MDLLIPIDRSRARALHDQVYDRLREAILDGRLKDGARLPSSRALAVDLGLSRFTVIDAYNRLLDEGFAVGRHGSGTFVAPNVTDRAEPAVEPDLPATRHWSSWSDRLAALDCVPDPAGEAEIDFRHALPDLDLFPHAVWRRLMQRGSASISLRSRYYGPAAGLPELRAALAGYLNRSRLIPCTAEQVVITSSSQEAVGLMAKVWLNEDDQIAFEEPGYDRARRTFVLAGAEVASVQVDHDGLMVDRLDAFAPRAKLAFVTPSHHYPTGAILSLSRRLALIEWARTRGALVLEDDYNSEFRFGARPIPALAGIDATTPGQRSVIYVGTLSKVLFPSLRLGYLVAPLDMVERVVAAKDAINRNAPYLEQATVAAFIEEGHFERHLGRVRRLYAERRAVLIRILDEELGNRARLHPSANAAGLHLLVELDDPRSTAEIVAAARAVGVHVDSAASCFHQNPPEKASLLMGFASLTEDRMREGIHRLASVLAS